MKPNIFIMATSMPDKHGFISLSIQNVYEMDAVEQADIVIFEINPNFPKNIWGYCGSHFSSRLPY